MRTTLFIISGTVISLAVLALIFFNSRSKTVYIEMGVVYEKFHLSKELNKDLEKVIATRKHILDSLYNRLREKGEALQLEKKVDPVALRDFKQQEEDYLRKQKNFESENELAVEKCNKEIWSQINRFTETYGKEKGFDYIFGANGQGNIMYASAAINVTDELVTYINTNYEDKNR